MPMATSDDRNDGFLSRWSRRKAEVRHGGAAIDATKPVAPVPVPAAPDTSPALAVGTGVPPATAAAPDLADEPATATPAPPTLDDVAALTQSSDYARFVAGDVDPGVRNAALKKLFSDPHYNVMDGLDTYIDDYGLPDPLPASMLRQMVQAKALGLFDDEEEDAAMAQAGSNTPTAAATSTDDQAAVQATASTDPRPAAPHPPSPDLPPDEDTDLRLQPVDAAGRTGPGPRAGEDPERQS